MQHPSLYLGRRTAVNHKNHHVLGTIAICEASTHDLSNSGDAGVSFGADGQLLEPRLCQELVRSTTHRAPAWSGEPLRLITPWQPSSSRRSRVLVLS